MASFTSIAGKTGIGLSQAAAAVPFLQSGAANALISVAKSRRLTVNSAIRSIPQQLFIYMKHKKRSCKFFTPAAPDQSNHLSGRAVDIQDGQNYVSAMQRAGFRYAGKADPVHFEYAGKELRRENVRAFQLLYNSCAGGKLAVDGVYGPATEAAMLQSPAAGWANCNARCN